MWTLFTFKCPSLPSGLLTGIVHDVQVVGQLGAGQVVLVRVTERREQDE